MTKENEPVAWAVREERPEVGQSPIICWSLLEMKSVEKSLPRCTAIPLYRQPNLILNNEEREALKEISDWNDGVSERHLVALRNLLERTKGQPMNDKLKSNIRNFIVDYDNTVSDFNMADYDLWLETAVNLLKEVLENK